MDSKALSINSIPCPLLELPAHLRSRIFHHALVHQGILAIHATGAPIENMDEWDKDTRVWAHFRPAEPSLTRTCLQIRAETLPIFYGCNVFANSQFYDMGCQRFLSWLTADKRKMLRHVYVGPGAELPPAFEYSLSREQAKRRLDVVLGWLSEREFELPKGSLYVATIAGHGAPVVWTNAPEVEDVCETSFCCGKKHLSCRLLVCGQADAEGPRGTE